MQLENEKSLKEAKSFLEKLDEVSFGGKYKLVFNEPGMYNYKIISAHFVVELQDKFSMKVLKTYGLYDLSFFTTEVDYETIDTFENRDYCFGFFDVLCEVHPDLESPVSYYYPLDFEKTIYFKKYYEYFDDKKGVRHYGLKLDNALLFIKENKPIIKKMVEINQDS